MVAAPAGIRTRNPHERETSSLGTCNSTHAGIWIQHSLKRRMGERDMQVEEEVADVYQDEEEEEEKV